MKRKSTMGIAHDRCASPRSVALLILVAMAGCRDSAGSRSSPGSTASGDGTGSAGSADSAGSAGVSGSGGGDAIETVNVGAIPIVEVAPIYLGKEKGFFKSRKMDLNITTGGGGNTIITGVLGDQLQFGFGNVTSFMMARDKGLQLKIVTNGASSTGQAGKDVGAVVVPGDSPIQSAKDLAGKTISVNQLNNIGDTTVRASVRKAGGDPKAVKFIAMPFPEAQPALERKQMDAAFLVEPFLTRAISGGARVISWIFVDTAPGMTIAVYFTSEQTLATRPDLVKRFAEAMNESLAYAQTHPDEAREILKTYTKIPPEIVPKLTLPLWPTAVNRASLQTIGDLAIRDGLVTNTVVLDNLFASRL